MRFLQTFFPNNWFLEKSSWKKTYSSICLALIVTYWIQCTFELPDHIKVAQTARSKPCANIMVVHPLDQELISVIWRSPTRGYFPLCGQPSIRQSGWPIIHSSAGKWSLKSSPTICPILALQPCINREGKIWSQESTSVRDRAQRPQSSGPLLPHLRIYNFQIIQQEHASTESSLFAKKKYPFRWNLYHF